MASETWAGVCVRCADLLVIVPIHILLLTVVATLIGAFVLVRYAALVPYEPNQWCNSLTLGSITVLRYSLHRRPRTAKSLARRKEIPHPIEGGIDHGAPATTMLV